jgi:integrin-linked kinase-associated serine/threonine phosphatase 2C
MGHKIGVSCEPEIEIWEPEKEDKFIILGSDGVWDVISSAETVGFVMK